MSNNVLTDSEIRRFQNQINISGIGVDGQTKIRNTRVAVVGAGGSGSAALQQLSVCGVGVLGIIDYGLVEESNIQRQTLYGGTDLGKLKTIISKKRLEDIFPHVQYELINLQLNSINAEFALREFDIIVDTTNNINSSFIINDACVALNKPVVYSYVTGNKITISVFNYNLEPLLKRAVVKNNTEAEGITNLACAFAGAFIASEVVKMIVGLPDILSDKIITYDCFNYSIQYESNISDF